MEALIIAAETNNKTMELTVFSLSNPNYAMIYLNGRRLESVHIQTVVANYGTIDNYLTKVRYDLINNTYFKANKQTTKQNELHKNK